MSIRMKLFLKRAGRKLEKKWYQMMKPLANYIAKREERKHQEFNDNITEEQAVKWIAKDIVKYLIRYNRQKVTLIVAERIDSEDFSGTHCLSYDRYNMIKSKKARKAYYKFNRNIAFQLRVVRKLKETKGVNVEEFKEEFEPWRHIKGYVMTYKISVG